MGLPIHPPVSATPLISHLPTPLPFASRHNRSHLHHYCSYRTTLSRRIPLQPPIDNARHIPCRNRIPALPINAVSSPPGSSPPSAHDHIRSLQKNPNLLNVDALDIRDFRPYTAATTGRNHEFVLPFLQSSFDEGLVHPQYEAIRAECDEWVLRGGAGAVCSKPARREAFVDSLIPLLVCRMIPSARSCPRRLVLVAKLLIWMTLNDDELDCPHELGADVDANADRVERIVAVVAPDLSAKPAASASCTNIRTASVMSPPVTASTTADDHETASLVSLREIWFQISCSGDMTPSLYSRFVHSFVEHLRAANVQAVLRSCALLPADFNCYAKIRRPASAFSILFSLAEYAMGTELDADTHAQPLLQELRQAAMDHMWVCNDLVSCRVEVAAGDHFNLPSVIHNGGNCMSFQEAVESTVRVANELDTRCVELYEAVRRRSDEEGSCGRVEYCRLITSCAAGMLSWSLQSNRYGSM